MLTFLLTSMAIAFVAGVIFDFLVVRGTLPANVNAPEIPEGFDFFTEAKRGLAGVRITPGLVARLLWDGVKGSRMVMRWMLFGVVIAAAIRVVFAPEQFQTFFRSDVGGLGPDADCSDHHGSLFGRHGTGGRRSPGSRAGAGQ